MILPLTIKLARQQLHQWMRVFLVLARILLQHLKELLEVLIRQGKRGCCLSTLSLACIDALDAEAGPLISCESSRCLLGLDFLI